MDYIQPRNVLTDEKHVILKLTTNDGDIAIYRVYDCLNYRFAMR
ncbi:MAG: hypothetical protein ACEY26_00750 [Candidatus Hodgkinia cicadicola]